MKTISIISAKGGVGTTTVASNLGVTLVRDFGKRVLVVDGNITTPTLGLQFGIVSQDKTLSEALAGEITIFQSIYMHPSGLYVIPSSMSIRHDYNMIDNLSQRLAEVKDSYDIILIDGAAGIGKEVVSVLKASDATIIITNPELPPITAAVKASKIAKAMNVPVIGIVLNKVRGKKYELGIKEIENLTESKVIGIIPYDESVPESSRQMTPAILYKKSARCSSSFKKLAGHITETPLKETAFDRLRAKIGI